MNFEVNVASAVLAQIGENGADREFLTDSEINSLDVKTTIDENNYLDFDNYKEWFVEYKVPFSLIEKYFKSFSRCLKSGIKCNFYKCGDKTIKPHYGTAFPIEYHKPSFHRPEFFRIVNKK